MYLNIHYCFLGSNRAPLLRSYFFVSVMPWICALNLFVVARDLWCVFGISDTRVALSHFMTCKQVSTYAGNTYSTFFVSNPYPREPNVSYIETSTLWPLQSYLLRGLFSDCDNVCVDSRCRTRHVFKDLLMYIEIACTLSMLSQVLFHDGCFPT